MTPDQYRREGFQAGIEAAKEVCRNTIKNYDVMEPGKPDRYASMKTQRAAKGMVRLAIQEISAIDVDEALVGLPTAPDAVARDAVLEEAAKALERVTENWDCGHPESRLCDCGPFVEQWGFAADEVRALKSSVQPEPILSPAATETVPVPVARLVEAASYARNRLEMIADESWHGDGRDLKRSIIGVFSDFDAALAACKEVRDALL